VKNKKERIKRMNLKTKKASFAAKNSTTINSKEA
jgi:hypothetical protein